MDIVIRATVIFFALYLIVRLLGKRELAQLTPFELIVLVVTGDLIQQGVTHNDFSLTGSILAVATFAFWASVLGWVTYLSRRAERVLDGEPRVIVRARGASSVRTFDTTGSPSRRSSRRCGWLESRTCVTSHGASSSRRAR